MKLYDPKEIRAILNIAAENSAAEESDIKMGLSLDELRQLASEVGIDPKEINKAAAEIESRSGQPESTFWGGPFSFHQQVLTEGEITPAQWEEMLLSIRDFFQDKGTVSSRASVMEWSSPWGSTNAAHVTALKNNGKTRISVSWKGPLTALPYFIPVPLVAIASLFFASEFLTLSSVPGVAFTLLATGLTFLAGRWSLRRNLAKGFNKLRKMLQGLEKIAGRTVSVSDQTDTEPIQIETPDELSNMLREDPDEADIEIKPRNRSKA